MDRYAPTRRMAQHTRTRFKHYKIVGGLMEFGRVLDPQPSSVVIGGYAACIVGFEPDPTEPAGRG